MAFTKQVARHDHITIDGTDYSNAFRSFGPSSEDSEVDVSGFSESGADETLAGARTASFTGEMYVTTETDAAMWTIHESRAVVPVTWQPNGLVDNTRPTWNGNCQLRTFPITDTRGDASTMSLTFTVADNLGIYMTGT